MFNPAILGLLRLLSTHPEGVGREVVKQQLGTPPDRMDRALDKLLELGVVEQRGDLVVPRPALTPLARKMERIAAHINRKERERDQAMTLVKVLLREP